jgi:hypothetical protein
MTCSAGGWLGEWMDCNEGVAGFMKYLSQCLFSVDALANDEVSGLRVFQRLDVATESGCVNEALRS